MNTVWRFRNKSVQLATCARPSYFLTPVTVTDSARKQEETVPIFVSEGEE
jgi:hypothetical protein